MNRSNLNPIKIQDSVNFKETQELLIWLVALKRTDLEVFVQYKYFCLMINGEWISLALCVHFKAFNHRESFFKFILQRYTGFFSPQNAGNWYF